VAQRHLGLLAGAGERAAELAVVDERLVGEARAPERIVRAQQRRDAHHVDVVVDDHQIARFPLRVGAAGGVGEEDGLRAEALQQEERRGDGFPARTFVVVAAALEDEGFDAGGFAPDETAGVAGDAGLAQAGNLFVGQHAERFEGIGDVAEAGAENHAELRFGLGKGFFHGRERGFERFAEDHGFSFLLDEVCQPVTRATMGFGAATGWAEISKAFST